MNAIAASLARINHHDALMHDPLYEQKFVIRLLTRSADLFAVLVSAAVSGFLFLKFETWSDSYHRAAIITSLLLTLWVFDRVGLYEPWRGRSLLKQAGLLLLASIVIAGCLSLIAYIIQVDDHYDHRWTMGWFVLSFFLLLIMRSVVVLVLRVVRSKGWNHKKVAIVGAGPWGKLVMSRLRAAEWTGLDVEVFIDSNCENIGSIDGIPVRTTITGLHEFIESKRINEVWLCVPFARRDSQSQDDVTQVLHELRHSTVDKRVVLDLADQKLLRPPVIEVLGLPVISLNSTPISGHNRAIKYVEDMLLSLTILAVLSPVLFCISVAIKASSPGPILFRQLRHGWDGRPFSVFKFRSMVIHAEQNGTVTQATKNDPRVTKVGRFIRRTSLDELPQFLNVLQGDMSIVGPRPHAIDQNEHYKDKVASYMQRHRVKPGITGWAQVNGWRGETDTLEKMQERIEHDLYYIEYWSIWLDLKIMFLTIFKGMYDKNAY